MPWWRWVVLVIVCGVLGLWHGRTENAQRRFVAMTRARWWMCWELMWMQVGAQMAVDNRRAHDDAEIPDGSSTLHADTMSGLHLVANSRTCLLVMRNTVVGKFEWSTRRELASSCRGLAGALTIVAEHAEAPPTNQGTHPINREDVAA